MKNPPTKRTADRPTLRKFWREWAKPLLVVLLVTSAFRSALADWNDVPTGSMKPTIMEGDRIFVNKLAYDLKVPFTTWHVAEWAEPKRGDIVVFFSPADGQRLVKRVVGSPGDTVALRDNQLYLNGEPASYESLDQSVIEAIPAKQRMDHQFANENLTGKNHPVMITPLKSALRSFEAVKVPAGHYFVMGDNRDNSFDSRYFGFVDRQRIVGRATAVVLSQNPDNHHLPRWSRFFTSLP